MSTQRSVWMREFQHRASALGGHPTSGIAGILYNEGRAPREAAEAMYGHAHGQTKKAHDCTCKVKVVGKLTHKSKRPKRDPDSKHTTTMPLVLKKVGSKWELYLDARAALYRTLKSTARTWLAKFPMGELVPLVKTGPKSVEIVVGGKPAKLSKKDAQHLAHMIGHYKLGIGSFTYTYVEEI